MALSLLSNRAVHGCKCPVNLLSRAGSQSATFTAPVLASDQDAQPQISASIQGTVLTTSPMIIGIRPTALTCSTGAIQAGNWLGCEVQLNSPNVPEVARLVVSSANPDLKIPAVAMTRPGQTRLTFQVYADPLATQAELKHDGPIRRNRRECGRTLLRRGARLVLNIPGERGGGVREAGELHLLGCGSERFDGGFVGLQSSRWRNLRPWNRRVFVDAGAISARRL